MSKIVRQIETAIELDLSILAETVGGIAGLSYPCDPDIAPNTSSATGPICAAARDAAADGCNASATCALGR
jgi:hypothetical protein